MPKQSYKEQAQAHEKVAQVKKLKASDSYSAGYLQAVQDILGVISPNGVVYTAKRAGELIALKDKIKKAVLED